MQLYYHKPTCCDLNMNKSFLLLLFLITVCLDTLHANGPDTLVIQKKLIKSDRPAVSFRSLVFDNPSMRYSMQNFSLTTISLNGWHRRKDQGALIQEGDGSTLGQIDVSSFVALDSLNRLFGSASYSNGRVENMRWNENLDLSVIHPYVIGDSIGGFMKKERYNFSGGYTHRFNNWRVGGELYYLAQIGYRDIDPRPQNITSDLSIKASVSRALGRCYDFGTSFYLRKYHQRSHISFRNDKGSTSVYQMLGLGMDYTRFAGTQFSAKYNGWGMGISIDLIPLKENMVSSGWSVSLQTDLFNLSKDLDGISTEPLNTLRDLNFGLEVSWIKESYNLNYGVKLLSRWRMRNGYESLFGEPIGATYPLLSRIRQYQKKESQIGLYGLLQHQLLESQNWDWKVMPRVVLSRMDVDHLSARRWVDMAHVEGGVDLQARWRKKSWLITPYCGLGYQTNLSSKHQLPGLNENSSIGQMIIHDIKALSNNRFLFDLTLRVDYQVTSNYGFLFLTRWSHTVYETYGKTNTLELSLGINF